MICPHCNHKLTAAEVASLNAKRSASMRAKRGAVARKCGHYPDDPDCPDCKARKRRIAYRERQKS